MVSKGIQYGERRPAATADEADIALPAFYVLPD
jgi:hypothetical protein